MPLLSAVYAQTQTFQQANCLSFPDGFGDGIPTLKCLEVLVQNILFASSSIIFFTLFVMLLWGGFQYLLAGGNKDKLGKAQTTLKFAIIGTVLFVSSYLLLNIIQFLFLGNPADPNNANLFKFEIPN